ncbi:hypothetical protein L3Q82_024565 [Scortum barcoo]|uniref:Uncharacterized protein n=1 Tax=Scortum barcoo TaxID=214431 RepID=A0ACB8WNV2_9TELE|nr:hypothetical protein L3Q82_024565 [Scortum barcoo]
MFTLSNNRGGISFYSPYYMSPYSPSPPNPGHRYTTKPKTTTAPWTTTKPPTTTTPWTTTKPKTTTTKPPTTTKPWTTTRYRPWTTTRYSPWTTRTYPYWTTTPPTRGVSVCLRYMIDQQERVPTIFTLSPSSRYPLSLGVGILNQYALSIDRYRYNTLSFSPYIRIWSDVGLDIWTRVCLTVDTTRNVAQVFSGPRMSIRKRLPTQYFWSGEPAIDFSGFDGQLTDVQIWDYPLHHREIFYYMNSALYGPFSGSVLTWSYVRYTPRGNTLLEDAYEWQEDQPVISKARGRGRRLKGEKKSPEFVKERKARKRQLL